MSAALRTQAVGACTASKSCQFQHKLRICRVHIIYIILLCLILPKGPLLFSRDALGLLFLLRGVVSLRLRKDDLRSEMVPLEEPWKLLKSLGSFKARKNLTRWRAEKRSIGVR